MAEKLGADVEREIEKTVSEYFRLGDQHDNAVNAAMAVLESPIIKSALLAEALPVEPSASTIQEICDNVIVVHGTPGNCDDTYPDEEHAREIYECVRAAAMKGVAK